MAVRMMASTESEIRFRMSMMSQMKLFRQAEARYKAGGMCFFAMRMISTMSSTIVTLVMPIWMPAEVLRSSG